MTALVEIAGSHHSAPSATRIGPVPPEQQVDVSVYLRGDDGDPLLTIPPGSSAGMASALSRAELASMRAEHSHADLAAVTAYATAHGLKVVGTDAARRLVKLSGPASAMEAAFHTSLSLYDSDGRQFRGRSGNLQMPAELAGRVMAVLGLDTSPIATPKFRLARRRTATGFHPNAVGAIYGLPAGPDVGAGQCIGIIELGGGYLDSDTAAAFAAMKLAAPTVVAVPVSGGSNAPGNPNGADGEVALDIQVAGGIAPGARIAVYFAPNTSQGFVDAISHAVHDSVNNPSVISISWGSAEVGWSAQAIAAMHAALKDAATLGVTVCAASGDGLATDGVTDGKAHVDFPASDPYVLGCGGTLLHAKGGKRSGETVWNANGGGTGGGVSASFARPAYQQNVTIPAAGGATGGRGVPDVAGDADPASGYLVVVDGKTEQIGGTSAVAPLWAGLIAAINAASGKPVGFAHPALYGDVAAFNDITEGDNKVAGVGFAAAAGWDACTGLGTPSGAMLAKLFGG